VVLAAGPSRASGNDSVTVAQQLLHDPVASSGEDGGLGAVAHGLVLPYDCSRRYTWRPGFAVHEADGADCPIERAGRPLIVVRERHAGATRAGVPEADHGAGCHCSGMAFFESIPQPPPPEPPARQRRRPWMQPETVIPGSVAGELLLVR